MTTGESPERSPLKMVYVRDSQKQDEPEFTNPEIKWLYCNDINIEQEKLQVILSLPRESLIADLKKVLEDSVRRFEYFRDKEDECDESDDFDDFDGEVSWFPMHAIVILGEIKASEAFESLLEVLKQDEDYLEFWFGDLIHYFFWEALYKTGADKLDRMLKLILNKETGATGRFVIIDCIEQVGHHQPERRNEVSDWFRKLFSSIVYSEADAALTDYDFGGIAVWSILDLTYPELMPEIEKLYIKGYASSMTCGSIEMVREEINKPYNGIGKQILMNTFDRYSEMSDILLKDMSDDPDDYDDSDFDDSDFDDSDLEDYDLEDDEGEGNTGYYNYNSEPYIAPYKPGRNDPCVCGSGKKYKKCCMNKPEN